MPANGVYLTVTRIDGILYPSVTNVGINPTVAEDADDGTTDVPGEADPPSRKTHHPHPMHRHLLRLETHILDFNKEIYKKNIEVSFIRKIREEIRFSSERQLAEQIAADISHARQAFKTFGEDGPWISGI
ncbi:MAG TPA: hypothetical protein DD727_02170 [Clostridiales bacterium]|nr:hypothetical protein [Clostridiales bacterium]